MESLKRGGREGEDTWMYRHADMTMKLGMTSLTRQPQPILRMLWLPEVELSVCSGLKTAGRAKAERSFH